MNSSVTKIPAVCLRWRQHIHMDSMFLLFNLATASSQLRNNTDIEREINKECVYRNSQKR
ncbi:MAG TPA: hypothetical protein VK250_00245 [Nitrososphaeraceae archaeon]|nr:hypothetical protein [Nitrososphaeraceae archaeon]